MSQILWRCFRLSIGKERRGVQYGSDSDVLDDVQLVTSNLFHLLVDMPTKLAPENSGQRTGFVNPKLFHGGIAKVPWRISWSGLRWASSSRLI